jgi:hypothetical protein
MLTFVELYHIESLFKNQIIIPRLRRSKVKVKVVNSAGFVLDFDSIRDAGKQLRPDWREDAFVAYGKDEFGKISEYLFVPPKNNNSDGARAN